MEKRWEKILSGVFVDDFVLCFGSPWVRTVNEKVLEAIQDIEKNRDAEDEGKKEKRESKKERERKKDIEKCRENKPREGKYAENGKIVWEF